MKLAKLSTRHIANLFCYMVLFLLPFGTRWIIQTGILANGDWQYGTLGIYAVEVLLIFLVILADKNIFRARTKSWWLSAFALLIVWAFVSTSWALFPRLALFSSLHLLEAFVIISILYHSFQNLPHAHLAFAFIAGAVLQAVDGIFQVMFQWVPALTIFGMARQNPSMLGVSVIETASGRLLRAYGSLPHPNILGGYLAVALLLLIPLIIRETKPKVRAFLWSAEVILTVGLFFTFSRSAWLGLVVGLFFLIWKFRTKMKEVIIVFLIVFGVFGFLFRDALVGRISANARLENVSTSERISGYGEAWTLIKEHPWKGVGIGNYTAALEQKFSGRPSYSYQPVHNAPLLILAELGIIGFLLLLIMAIDLGYRLIKKRSVGTALLIGIAVISMFDHYLWSLFPGVMLGAVVLGLCFDPVTSRE